MARVHTSKGYTLIELLLYVGISAGVLLVSTFFLQALLESRIKNQTVDEVEHQGLRVIQLITQTIRNAENITSPIIGSSSSSLTLDVSDVVDDPTIFGMASGTIRIIEGSGSAISLTNSRVTASSLLFQNLSRLDTPGSIRVSFTLTHVNVSGRQEYEFSKTFYASASVRQP